jgi:colicin import membrane protein
MICSLATVATFAATAPAAGQTAPDDTQRVRAALMRQLIACWLPPPGSIGANVTVAVRFTLNRDGSLASEPVLVRTATGAPSQALAESALHAVRVCAPLKLPAAQYELWNEVEVVFDSRARSSAGPPNASR